MKTFRLALVCLVVFLGSIVTLSAQTHPCDANAAGPFIVQSARAFTLQFCTAITRQNPDNPTETIPERIDGHYLQVDAGPKIEIFPTDLGISSVTNRRGWSYVSTAGVAKGSHTVTLSQYNFVLNGSGLPTTQRAEGAPVVTPFSAADPVYNLPPLGATGVRIIR